jgi:hypothetical protein
LEQPSSRPSKTNKKENKKNKGRPLFLLKKLKSNPTLRGGKNARRNPYDALAPDVPPREKGVSSEWNDRRAGK